MNIAIFGGSFDPPHLGHEAVIKSALANLDIDRLIIVPTFLSPFKSKFSAPPDVRMRWCADLWGNLDPKITISDYEICQNRAVFTIDSVQYFKSKFDARKIYLIIGADQLENLHKWHKFNELKELVSFVVAYRDGANLGVNLGVNLQKLDINVKISSTQIRTQMDFRLVPSLILSSVKNFYKEKNAKQNR